jgi:hypothetical protein
LSFNKKEEERREEMNALNIKSILIEKVYLRFSCLDQLPINNLILKKH